MPELFAVERRREEARAAEPEQRERRPARDGEGRRSPAPGLSPDAMRVHYRTEGTPPPAEPGAAPVQRLRPPGGAAPVVQRLALMAQVPHPDDVECFEMLKDYAVTYPQIGSQVLDYDNRENGRVEKTTEPIAFLGHGTPTELGNLDAEGIVNTVKAVLVASTAVRPVSIAPKKDHEESRGEDHEESRGEGREESRGEGREESRGEGREVVEEGVKKVRTNWRGSIYLMGCSTGRSYRGNEKEPVPDDEKSLAERVEQAYNSSIEPDVTDVVGTFVSMCGRKSFFNEVYMTYPEVDKKKVNERLPKEQRGPLAENPLKMKLVRMLTEYQNFQRYAQTILDTYVETTACKEVEPIQRGTPAEMRIRAINFARRVVDSLSQMPVPNTIPWLAGAEMTKLREELTDYHRLLDKTYKELLERLRTFHSFIEQGCASRLEQVSLYDAGAGETTLTASTTTDLLRNWVKGIYGRLPANLESSSPIDIDALGGKEMRFNRINETFHTSEAKRRREEVT